MVKLKVNDTNHHQFAKATGCFAAPRFAPLKLKERRRGFGVVMTKPETCTRTAQVQREFALPPEQDHNKLTFA